MEALMSALQPALGGIQETPTQGPSRVDISNNSGCSTQPCTTPVPYSVQNAVPLPTPVQQYHPKLHAVVPANYPAKASPAEMQQLLLLLQQQQQQQPHLVYHQQCPRVFHVGPDPCIHPSKKAKILHQGSSICKSSPKMQMPCYGIPLLFGSPEYIFQSKAVPANPAPSCTPQLQKSQQFNISQLLS
jgi:hypothetical protein